MRIAFDATVLGRTGIYAYVKHVTQALAAEANPDQRFLFYSLNPLSSNPLDLHALQRPGVEIRQWRQRTHETTTDRVLATPSRATAAGWLKPLAKLAFESALPSIIGTGLPHLLSADVIHCSDVFPIKKRAVPSVVTIYDMTTVLMPQWHARQNITLNQRAHTFARHQASGIIAISEATKRDICTLLKIPEQRVHLAYGAPRPGFRVLEDGASVQARLTMLGIDRPYLLFVGGADPRKNLDNVLRAHEIYVQRQPEDCPLLVVAGVRVAAHAPASTSHGRAAKHVRYLGYVSDDDLVVLYNGTVAMVYPSWYEGFGLPILEAMACGCPVITSNTSSMPEVAGDAAILVSPGNSEEIAEAMIRLVGNSTLGHDLRTRSLQRAALFSWDQTARQIISVYSHITDITT